MYPYHFTYLKKNEQGPSTVEPSFETDYFPISDRGIEFMQCEVLGPVRKSEVRKRVDKEEVWNRKMAFEEESLERNKRTASIDKSSELHPIDLFCDCPEKPQIFYMHLVAEDPERAVLQHENMLPDPLDDIYNRV